MYLHGSSTFSNDTIILIERNNTEDLTLFADMKTILLRWHFSKQILPLLALKVFFETCLEIIHESNRKTSVTSTINSTGTLKNDLTFKREILRLDINS